MFRLFGERSQTSAWLSRESKVNDLCQIQMALNIRHLRAVHERLHGLVEMTRNQFRVLETARTAEAIDNMIEVLQPIPAQLYLVR